MIRGVSLAVEGAAFAALDRRLLVSSPRPVAVAVSGGGDSVALLLLADRWARAHERRLLVLSVDHRLRPEGAGWTRTCGDLASELGADFRALAWDGPKPARGLPAAARAARHRLLADAAREAGASVLLVGHTADDVLEARAMRRAGSTTPEPRAWSPSPAWPEGRGLFLLRPLLGLRRAALRAWLAAEQRPWIEDPANQDLRFARARARAELTEVEELSLADPPPLALAQITHCAATGALTLARTAIREAAPDAAGAWLGLAAVCAGGGARLPSAAARDRLAGRLRAEGPVVATLAGARIIGAAGEVLLVRESGEAARGGLARLALAAGDAVAWDGRFELTAAQGGLEARPLKGLAGRLPADQRRALADVPAEVRPSLPAVMGPADEVTCPLLGEAPAAAISLVGERLRAAAGLVEREPD